MIVWILSQNKILLNYKIVITVFHSNKLYLKANNNFNKLILSYNKV